MSFASISFIFGFGSTIKMLTLESGIFVHLIHTYLSPVLIYYFSLLILSECWSVLYGPDSAVGLNVKKVEPIFFPPWGLPFGLQVTLLKMASLCLMPLLSQIQLPAWLSRSETKPLCSRAACCMHCLPVVFRHVLSVRLWQDFVGIVSLGFCIFDHACHTREKAEDKMLVSLEYMCIKLTYCFPRSAQYWQVGGTLKGKRKENSKPIMVVQTFYWECLCYRLLLSQTSHLRSLPQLKPLVK